MLEFDFSGFNPDRAVSRIREAAMAGLYQFGEAIMMESKEKWVPVDLGNLKSSGHVQKPVIEGGDIIVRLGYGGPAAPYAIIVHEDLSARHGVGQAKYLELPVLQNGPRLRPFVAAFIRREVGG